MIYAVIIIIALALAFIILVRRLPRAIELANQDKSEPSPSQSTFHWPTIKLPTIHLPTREPNARTIEGKTPLTIPKLPKFNWPKFNWPKFSLPKIKLPSLTQRQSKPTVKEGFWQDQTSPVESVVIAEPTNEPKPIEPVAVEPPRPIEEPNQDRRSLLPKLRGRNLTQEAEDAFAIKDYKKAERLYLRLATESPKDAKIYGRLGVIYLEQKNLEDARDALQQAIKLEPNFASRHFNLALTYLELGSKTKAIGAMEAALKYEPSNRKYRKMLDNILTGRA